MQPDGHWAARLHVCKITLGAGGDLEHWTITLIESYLLVRAKSVLHAGMMVQ